MSDKHPSGATEAWNRFHAAANAAHGARIMDLFASEPDRLSRLTLDAAGLFIDLSKQSWTRAAHDACIALAQASGV